jgi:azurin
VNGRVDLIQPQEKNMTMTRPIVAALVGLFALSACSGNSQPTPEATPAEPVAAAAMDSTTPAPAEEAPVQLTSLGDVQAVVLKPVGDEMKWEATEFTVKAGSTVKLTLQNVAKSPAMQHNVVILKPKTDINTIGMAGMQAGPTKQYVPADAAVLFSTPLALPGETKEIEFTAPPAGDYPFICTFPGHYVLMQGVMHSVN